MSRLWAIILRCGVLWAGHKRWHLNSPPSHRQLLSRWKTRSCNYAITFMNVRICHILFFIQICMYIPFDIGYDTQTKYILKFPRVYFNFMQNLFTPCWDFQQETEVTLQSFPGKGSPWEHLQLPSRNDDQRHEDLPEPACLGVGGFPAGCELYKLTTNGWGGRWDVG